jgi:hypothetical protein
MRVKEHTAPISIHKVTGDPILSRRANRALPLRTIKARIAHPTIGASFRRYIRKSSIMIELGHLAVSLAGPARPSR